MFWTYSLIWNSYFAKCENSEVISQHLLINLDLGPSLKCAPGHESIEDFSIIKSYWLKIGVVDFQKSEICFSTFSGGPPQPSHPPEYFLEISLWVWLKIEVWPYQRHWHIPRDRVSPSTRKCPGHFLLDGISLDPTSRRKFPGSVPPDVEKTIKTICCGY